MLWLSKAFNDITDGPGANRPGKEAEEADDDAHATVNKANEEIKELEAERQALDFRLKAMRGNWKRWIVKEGK